jgi:transcriptional regulator GlxA family with amidase domain
MSAALLPVAPAARAPSLSPRALARVRTYVDAHLRDTITLTDLAAAACISRFHFARLFRASTGASPMQYVRHARVAAAKTMLAQENPSICAVAVELGFFDQSHFTRTFRRVTGMPPGRFKRPGG